MISDSEPMIEEWQPKTLTDTQKLFDENKKLKLDYDAYKTKYEQSEYQTFQLLNKKEAEIKDIKAERDLMKKEFKEM